jgi:hypothetical protein
MNCILCGSEADQVEMHHLVFSVLNRHEFERQFPDTDLDAGLRDVGVCTDCMRLSRGQRRILVAAANGRTPNELKSPRILH